MNNSSLIPIFFSVDDNYLPFLAVSMRSLIDNASEDYCYRIHILNNGISKERVAPVLAMATDNVEIALVDVGHEIRPLLQKLRLRDYYTVSIYYRLFIASLFPQYHKAIYLDADITVCGDVSGLYNIPLGQRLVAAVSDDIIASKKVFRDYAENAIGVPFREYFNSGVLLMNLDRFRTEEIQKKFVYLLETYHFETICPDQDYLNVLCRGRVLYLDKGWNKMSLDRQYNGTPNLVHYNMFFKPWQYQNICYEELFWHYAENTPFYGEILKIKKEFGWRGKWEHRKGYFHLCRNARRIAKAKNNFKNTLFADPAPDFGELIRESAYDA